MQVRRLGTEDFELAAEAIRTVKQPEAQPSFSAEYMRRFLARPENVLSVAERDGLPTGFLVAYMLDRVDRDRRMVCLYEIGVSGSYRQRGAGRAMIEALKALCRQEDTMKTWVLTNRSNVAAVRLYETTGAVAGTADDEVTFVYQPEE